VSSNELVREFMDLAESRDVISFGILYPGSYQPESLCGTEAKVREWFMSSNAFLDMFDKDEEEDT